MRVIYVSYDGMTDPLGQSQVIPYLAGLSSLGHTITIVSCEKKERFEKQQQYIQQMLNKHNISWYPVPYSRLPSVLSKQFNLSAINKKVQRLCKEQKPEIIHCRSYMAALIGLKIKQKYGVKFIFDMRGFWADERIDGQIWSMKNKIHKRIYAFFKKKEIAFLDHADYTVSLTENAKKEIHSWKTLQKQPIPIEVIPCCADLDLFSPASINPEKIKQLKTELHIRESDLVISYLGSIGTWYMLDEMLDFFSCLLQKNVHAKILFITPDAPEQILKKAREKNIPAGKIMIRSASRMEVPQYLSLSAISIYFIKPLYSKKASSPTKTAEIMGLGIPIITNTGIGDSDRILNDAKSGILINDFSEAEYTRAIEQINVLLKMDPSKIMEASRNYFSLDKGIRLYNSVYQKLKS
ncbi:MAG: hypothetical protein JWP12_1132 [Bacteroidetes bacterium]|nr:hypothetical protein [Bacteroidota bacterium]